MIEKILAYILACCNNSEFEQTTFVHVPDRIDRLITILGRKVASQETPTVTANSFIRPFNSIMAKIMELRPNG